MVPHGSKKILVHLGLWETRNHDPPPKKTFKANHIDHSVPELPETVYDNLYDDFSQLTPYDDDYSQVAVRKSLLKNSLLPPPN